MKKAGVNTKKRAEEEAPGEDNPFYGKTCVVTGTLAGYSREEAQALIRKLGGKPSASISSKTDYLIAGTDPGSKLDKAGKLGVKIIDERDFNKMTGR